MLRKIIITTGFAIVATGCSTISEESCIAGSWESLGYESGRNGDSRGHFNKIAETCTKYGIAANATEFRLGYDQGLPLYCSYEKGFTHGESGGSVKAECLEIKSEPYLDGYDEGHEVYLVQREYKGLIETYNETRLALEDVVYRLNHTELDDSDRKRLHKKKRRLNRNLDDARIDVRAFERIQGWSKQVLPAPDYGDGT